MKLRKKPKIEIEQYYKMFELRSESLRVLNILQMVFKRDSLKKSISQAEHREFEMQYEGALRERGGMANGFKGTLKHDLERVFRIRDPAEVMPYHVEQVREPILNKQ